MIGIDIDYETADKLIVAKYPNSEYWKYTDPVTGEEVWIDDLIPTLSELIQQCGEPITLWIMSNRTDVQKGGTEISETGATPEIAVANLYIATHPSA